MPATAATTERLPPAATRAQWLGRRLCDVFLLFLVIDAVTKLVPAECMTDVFARIAHGASLALSRGLSLATLVCALLYVSPRTSSFGATLLNGLLGGAIGAVSQDPGQPAKKIRARAARRVDFPLRRSSLPTTGRRGRHCAPVRSHASSHARS